MKIYAIIGSNAETIDCTSTPKCPPGHIEMTGQRQTPDHVAQADGTWAIPAPTKAAAESKRDALLSATDWYAIRAAEPDGTPIPENVLTYRRALRELDNDPAWPDVEWPVLERDS